MRRLFTATIVAAAAVVLTPAAGSASPYKWCATYSGDMGGGTNCGFVTIEQCRATVHGMGGFCNPNPFYTGPAERPAKRERKQRNN